MHVHMRVIQNNYTVFHLNSGLNYLILFYTAVWGQDIPGVHSQKACIKYSHKQ